MKFLLIFLGLTFLFDRAFAQENVIPTQYRPIKEIFGDLNKDGIDEKVVVYNMTDKEDEVNGINREIIIFRKDKDGWIVWHRSLKAIGNSKDGGMMGDPFEDIEITKGILIISHSGGSSWKWGHSDKYRFQNNAFELIGYTSNYGKPCEYWENFDYNLVTGKIILKKEYEKCNDDESQVVYKIENENFSYQLKKKITLANRNDIDVKIISPKYKHDLYL